MKSRLFRIFQYIILLSLGLAFCVSFFRDFNINELYRKIYSGNFSWFYLIVFVSALVYVFRVLRWQMLIKAIGHSTSFGNAFSALSIGYFVNFFFPRLGEVTRCLSLKKVQRIPFMQLFGTVIIERIIDIVSLIVVLLLSLILQFNQIIEFVTNNIFLPIYTGIIIKIPDGNAQVLMAVLSTIVIVTFLFLYFLVTKVVMLYGVGENSGKMLAALIHGGQTLLPSLWDWWDC